MSKGRTERTFRTTAGALLLAASALMLGCSRTTSTDRAVTAYEAALGVLSPSVASESEWRDIAWPDVRTLRLETEEVRVGLLRFMDLDACGVGAMIAERNSALGLMAADSSVLLYEHELLARLSACRERLETDDADDDLRTLLDETLEVKRRNASRVFWNATLGSREFGSLFSRATTPFSASDGHPEKPAQAALELLVDVGRNLGRAGGIPDEDRYWEAYRVLEQDRYGGRLVTTMNRVAPVLLRGAPVVERMATLCRERPAEVAAAARIWRDEMQPVLQRLEAGGGQWMAAFDGLVVMQRPVEPAAFSAWYSANLDPGDADSSWRRMLAAAAVHADAWAKVEAGCP